MAKKKFDKSKYQPTAADIDTLAEAFAAYAEECRIAVDLMRQKSTDSLIVSNWDTVQRSIAHVDNFMRQVVPAAKFGRLDAKIYGLLAEPTQQAATAEADAAALRELQKPKKKGGTKS